jgi:hypothetical protein
MIEAFSGILATASQALRAFVAFVEKPRGFSTTAQQAGRVLASLRCKAAAF